MLSPEATDPLGLKAFTFGGAERLPKVLFVDVGPPPKKEGIEEPVDVAVLVDGPKTDDPSPNFRGPAELALKAGRDIDLLSD